jgi:hypothetical protein
VRIESKKNSFKMKNTLAYYYPGVVAVNLSHRIGARSVVTYDRRIE